MDLEEVTTEWPNISLYQVSSRGWRKFTAGTSLLKYLTQIEFPIQPST